MRDKWPDGCRLARVDPREATDAEWRGLASLQRQLLIEQWPDGDAPGLDGFLRFARHTARQAGFACWLAISAQGEAVAGGTITPDSQGRREAASVVLIVRPDRRRLGIGSGVLRVMLRHARERGIESLAARTDSCIPAGERFARSLSAEPGIRAAIQQLSVADVNLERLAAADEDRPDVRLTRLKGRYPDEQLESIARLKSMIAGSYGTRIEDLAQVGRFLRDAEETLAALEFERWTLCAISSSGELLGYTETLWDPSVPSVVEQGGTCVAESARGAGLARRLKTRMLALVLRERPAVRTIVTVNPSEGAAILQLNRELGFRLHHERQAWSVKVGDLAWIG